MEPIPIFGVEVSTAQSAAQQWNELKKKFAEDLIPFYAKCIVNKLFFYNSVHKQSNSLIVVS